ncbi:hypothetical protein TSUD_320160 [Trifolium subterraneum]|uniref:Auxin-induced protein n=1 Tax=Trifolium subterraneum TaxID=3900 RepID=A0A2Z6N169_TRISU|nr:hypothetical protein TSUD_320160 [Trifolium subterraneum]
MGFRSSGIIRPRASSSKGVDVPKGYLAVYVGEEIKQFLIPISYLNQPSFQELLNQAEEQFEYDHPTGGLTIPCREDMFLDISSRLISATCNQCLVMYQVQRTTSSISLDDDIVDDEVPSGFIPTLMITMPSENSGSIPSVATSSSPPKQNTLTPLVSVVEDCNPVLKDVQFKDADESIETSLSSDRICDDGSKTSNGGNIVEDVPSCFMLCDNSVEDGLNAEKNSDADAPSSLPPSDRIYQSEIQTESYSYLSKVSIAELEQRISRLEECVQN